MGGLTTRQDGNGAPNRGGADGLLSESEERDLARRSAAGDPAAEARLVQSHLRLVAKLARAYKRYGAPEPDLIQEGTIGLIKAVRKFDPDRDVRLSTYALWWVRAAMQEHVVRSWSLVRLGKSAAHRALFFNLRRGEAAIPAAEEALGRLIERFRLPTADIRAMARRLAQPDLALDAPLPGSGPGPDAATIGERLASGLASPEDQVSDRRLQRLWTGLLDKALAMLPDREAHIIRVRHLHDPSPTFEAIGRELGISKDRVRQLEQRALARLRSALAPLATAHGLPGG